MIMTLPGDIPGLLRRGSIVFYCESAPATVLVMREIRPDVMGASIALDGQNVLPDRCVDAEFRHLALDLTDPTGRWHAALWARAARNDEPWSLPENDAVDLALLGVPLKPYEITLLRNVVLRLAGRAP